MISTMGPRVIISMRTVRPALERFRPRAAVPTPLDDRGYPE